MSVMDNVLTGLTRLGRSTFLEIAFRVGRHGVEHRSFRGKAEEILDFLEIAPYRETVVGSLPYGLQKRVEFARALVASPKLLPLDDPMAGMNADEKVELGRFISNVNQALRTPREDSETLRTSSRSSLIAPFQEPRARESRRASAAGCIF
jgi:branched-chain amino acid transport system ATP-binding protein